MSVTVVARTHPFRETNEIWQERAGVAIERILRKLSALCRKLPVVVQINGVPIDKELWAETRPKDGDLVNIRVLPAGGKGGLGVVGMGIGAASLGLAALLSRSKAGNAAGAPATQNNTLAPPPEPSPDPTPVPIDGFGGYKDNVMPQITGVSNQANPYGPIPRVYGTFRMSPVLAAQPYYTIEGNDQWLYALFSCGLGPLDISEIKIGNVSIDDYVTAGVCTYEVLSGTNPATETPTIYTNDIATTDVGTTLTSSTTTVVAAQTATQLSVNITFPDGLYGADRPTWTLSSAGQVVSGPNPATDFYANVAQTCSFSIEYRIYGSGSGWTSRTLNVTANEQGVKRASDTWSVTSGLYEVRIAKTTSDAVTTSTTYNPADHNVAYQHYVTPVQTARWDSLKAIRTSAPINIIKDVNGSNVSCTYIAVKVKASELLNGTLENLSCLCKSKLRSWNGSSWDAAAITANPAWVFADIITGSINGGQLDDTYIDTDGLKDWADFCDSKGFTFNGVVDDFIPLPELLKQVTACGRASVNCVDGLIGVIVDKARTTVVQMFTPANTTALRFRQTKPRIPHGIKVNFVNPDSDWVTDQRVVYDDGYTSANARLYETYDFKGVTNATQAYKLARYQLACARLRPGRYILTCDWMHLNCNRGDLVALNYDVVFYGLYSGLINSVTDNGTHITAIELNQEVYFDGTSTYGAKIQLSDGTFTTQQVTGSGWTSTLTLVTPFALATTPHPARNNIVGFGYWGTEAANMLVEQITHNSNDLTATVTLVDYSPTIYDADTGTIPAYTPNVSVQHPGRRVINPPVIADIKSDETVLLRDLTGSLITRILISVQAPTSGGVAYIETSYRKTGEENWLPGGSAPASGAYNVYIVGVEDGTEYDLRVKFADYAGVSSEWTLATHTVVGKTTLPPDVPDVRLQGTAAIFPYDISTGVNVPQDFAGFRIKYAMGQTNNWAAGFTVAPLQIAQSFDLQTLPSGSISLMIKAVDTAGNESENVAVLYKNIVGTLTDNLYVSTDEHTAWSGTKTQCSVIAGELVADDSGVVFWNSPSSNFWNSDPLALFWDVYFQDMIYEWQYQPDATIRDPYKIFLDYSVDADVYFVEYMRASQIPFWETDPDALFWDAVTSDLFWPDTTSIWLPYPQGGIDGARELYTFRIRANASTVTQSTIHTLTTRVDVPDVEETIEQVISAGGTRLTLTESYYQIVDCQVTLLYSASYPTAFTVQVIDKDATSGPLIKVFNSSGTSVDGLINARIKGY